MSCPKPLIIGQAPGPSTDPLHPLCPLPRSGTGGRLAEFAGLTAQEYTDLFDRANLLQFFPGKWKRDDKFPRVSAAIAASAMKPLLRGRCLILLGRNVAGAFGYSSRQLSFHDCFYDHIWGFEVVVIPHPSGRNRWYRDAENLKQSQEFWAKFIRFPRFLGSRGGGVAPIRKIK